MPQIGTQSQIEEPLADPLIDELGTEQVDPAEVRARAVGQLRLVWNQRKYLGKALLAGLLVGLITAFLIPAKYESTVQLMPPDSQSSGGMAMLAALAGKAGSGGGGSVGGGSLGSLASDLLGVKTSGALFVGILGSRTIQDRLVQRFDLKKVYGNRLDQDARKRLADRTSLNEDHKSGIISITVTDHDPRRAAAMAQAYVEELNQVVTDLSTSAAHRERVFLESRLTSVKRDLDDASVKFSQFASKNSAIDIKEQGRAMVDAAAKLQGEMIAAQSELAGLEQIYMSNNIRVRSVRARIAELESQLQKLGGTTNPDAKSSVQSDAPYPSIRELPLLGVAWTDLYRQTRIQEAVFETLTQQYELAKVQEAKETPSVKVLDAAQVPEKRSFPSRTLFACVGGLLFVTVATVGIFARVQWDQTDDKDPGKVFAQEVFHAVRVQMPWAARSDVHTDTPEHRTNDAGKSHETGQP